MTKLFSINSEYKRSLLAGLELFKGVTADDIQSLLQKCDRRDLDKDEILISPEQKNEHVYVVLSGSLNVHVGAVDTPILAAMDVGACVGEMSIIEDRDPSAYVVGAEQTHLLVIHQSILWEMVDASHEFAKNLLVVLSERVRSHNKVIAESFGELRKFEEHATTDALTGLNNRFSMEEKFNEVISRCEKNDQPVSLIMVDIDNFKDFNDKFGHMAGDRALSAVAVVLKQQFRPRDLLVRFGGDEFAVLLPETDEDVAIKIADRVRQTVSGSTGDGSDSLIRIPVRISLGVAQLESHGTLTTLIRAADAALYRAKEAGRDTVSL